MAKFNYKKVSGKQNFKGWKDWQVGDYVAGKFMRTAPGYKGSTENPNYIIEIYETSFEDMKEGSLFSLNHNGLLKFHMEDKGVQVGDIIKVEYEGREPMKDDPSTEAHQVALYLADSTDMKVEEADLPEDEEDEEEYDL